MMLVDQRWQCADQIMEQIVCRNVILLMVRMIAIRTILRRDKMIKRSSLNISEDFFVRGKNYVYFFEIKCFFC